MTPVPTYDLLRSLGFVPNPNLISDRPGGLTFDFGNFTLDAICTISRFYEEIVMLLGVMQSERRLCKVRSEMPRTFESREQGIAWITWCLDHHAPGKKFIPARPVNWLTIGRQNTDLLPWERQRIIREMEQAAYAARPHCRVQRDFARVGRRHLAELLAASADDAPVTFEFDGEVLLIHVLDQATAMPANGDPWPERFSIRAGAIRNLPKRFMNDPVEFGIWNGSIDIDRCRYKDNASDRNGSVPE
ncbi:MAG: hypothetical protein GXY44_08760 [Phycisphaerales bacterium]|nr:hypothetical protein [Phycisphaerales bacterium]